MVKETARQEFLLTTMLFTFNSISYSYSSPAEYYQVLFTLNSIILAQLCVADEGPTIEWSYLPRKVVRENRLSLRGHGECILVVLKVVACRPSCCRGNTFPSQSCLLYTSPSPRD